MLSYPFFVYLFLLITGLMSISGQVAYLAAQSSTWREPVKIRLTDQVVGTPLLITDSAGRLHLFWNEIPSDTDQNNEKPLIYYMMKDGEKWSDPVDILIVNGNHGGSVQGYIDQYGLPFIVFGGVNESLQFSKAKTQNPTRAQDWSQPVTISPRQLGGSLVVDSDNNVHFISGDLDGQIRYFRMDDQSRVTLDSAIDQLPGNELLLHPASLLVGSDGTLHAVIPAITPPFEGTNNYYTRSRDSGNSWSKLKKIPVGRSDTWSIAEDQRGWLHVLFIVSGGIGGRYHRYSDDGGENWSEPTTISLPADGTGFSGGGLAVASAGILHAAFGLQTDTVIAHSYWTENDWSPWQEISGEVPGPSEFMSISITHGNRIHVVWESDSNSIWYVEGRSTSPETMPEELAPLPTANASRNESSPVIKPSQEDAPIIVTNRLANELVQQSSQSNGRLLALALGTAAAAGTIGLAIMWQKWRRN